MYIKTFKERKIRCLNHIPHMYIEVVGYKKDIVDISKTSCWIGRKKLHPGLFTDKIVKRMPCGLYNAAFFNMSPDWKDEFTLFTRHDHPDLDAMFKIVSFKYHVPVLKDWCLTIWNMMKKERAIKCYSRDKIHAWNCNLSEDKLTDYVNKIITKNTPITYEVPKKEYGMMYGTDDSDTEHMIKAIGECIIHGIWAGGNVPDHLYKGIETGKRPLMPLRKGHVGMIFASGMLNNTVIKKGKHEIVVNAFCEKGSVEIKKSANQQKDIQVFRDVMVSRIKVADISEGTLYEISN